MIASTSIARHPSERLGWVATALLALAVGGTIYWLLIGCGSAARTRYPLEEYTQYVSARKAVRQCVEATLARAGGPVSDKEGSGYKAWQVNQAITDCEEEEARRGAAPAAPAGSSARSGCAKDADCKGDRVCLNGRCEYPQK